MEGRGICKITHSASTEMTKDVDLTENFYLLHIQSTSLLLEGFPGKESLSGFLPESGPHKNTHTCPIGGQDKVGFVSGRKYIGHPSTV